MSHVIKHNLMNHVHEAKTKKHEPPKPSTVIIIFGSNLKEVRHEHADQMSADFRQQCRNVITFDDNDM